MASPLFSCIKAITTIPAMQSRITFLQPGSRPLPPLSKHSTSELRIFRAPGNRIGMLTLRKVSSVQMLYELVFPIEGPGFLGLRSAAIELVALFKMSFVRRRSTTEWTSAEKDLWHTAADPDSLRHVYLLMTRPVVLSLEPTAAIRESAEKWLLPAVLLRQHRRSGLLLYSFPVLLVRVWIGFFGDASSSAPARATKCG